jgi:hypothetical protein
MPPAVVGMPGEDSLCSFQIFREKISTSKTMITILTFVYPLKLVITEMIPTTITGKAIMIPQLALSASINPSDGPINIYINNPIPVNRTSMDKILDILLNIFISFRTNLTEEPQLISAPSLSLRY